MSFATCDREATLAPGYFQLNPPGRGSLGEFPRRFPGQYRNGHRRFARSLKFSQTPYGDCNAIPITQHRFGGHVRVDTSQVRSRQLQRFR